MKKALFFIMIFIYLGTIWAQDENLLQKSYTYENDKKYKEAIDIMKILQKKEPRDPFYVLRLGWLNYSNKSYKNALEYYRLADSILDSNEAKEGIMNCLIMQSQWDNAIATGISYLQNNSQHSTWIAQVGYAYYMDKNYKESLKYYKKYNTLYPWDFDGQAMLLRSAFYAGDMDMATNIYNKFKKYLPKSTVIAEFAGKIK